MQSMAVQINLYLGSNFMSQYAGLSFYQKIVLMNKKTKIMLMLLLAIPYFIFYLLYLLFDFISFRLHKILIWFNNVIQR